MKTVIYARKSTDKDSQKDTVDNQIKICRRRAKELKLTIVDIKQDSATGTNDNHRDEIKELIKGASEGKYECVIMKGVSRFFRDVEMGLGVIKKLDRSGVRVITVEEGFDSFEVKDKLGYLDTSMITMWLMFAEKESRKTAERIKYTQLEKAYAGEWNQASSPPFGYNYSSSTKKLEVNIMSSEIIKLIFHLYIEGLGMKSIAHYLNGENDKKIQYPSPRGKLWSQYTIGFILKNQVYVGDVVYNKRSKTSRPYKNPQMNGKTDDDVYYGNDFNDKKDWIITKDSHEAIISRETYQIVQDMMGTKAIRTGIKNNISLLAGIAKCGKCGTGMTFKRGNKDSNGNIKTRSNYYCSNYIKYGKRHCDSHHVGASEFEEFVINNLKLILKEKLDYNKLTYNVKGSKNNQNTISNKIKKIEQDIQSLLRKSDVLLEKNIEQTISDIQFAKMNEKYLGEINVLSHQLEKLTLEEVASKEDKNTKGFIDKAFENIVNIEAHSKERQRYILLDLINQIKVTDGEIEINYKF